jgi:RNA polymerase sigma-70 factor (ECF subfamily)
MTYEFSDIELIEKYLGGDSEAFDALYSRYRKQLYAYLNRLIPGQYALVDDIFQNTWVKVIRQLPKYHDKQRFIAWIMRIAHNLAIDHFRKFKNEILSDDTESSGLYAVSGDEPWRNLDSAELMDAIGECVAKLKEEQREVFILRQDDLSFKEIAAVQSCSVNTALGRMQYAIRNLRKCLSHWKF